jgi:hypothetical protein
LGAGEATDVAESANPPENAAPKAGAAAPAPLELIASVTAVLEGGEAKAQWKVAGKAGDDGEYEYLAVARIPDQDLASNPAGQTPLHVFLMPDRNVIATQVNAVGGGQVAGTRVRLVDPDTNLAEGEAAETDEQGRVLLVAPENKPYRIRIVEDDDDVEDAPSEVESDEDDRRVNDAGPSVLAKVVGPGGAPRANIDVQLTPPGGGAVIRARTDANGVVEVEGVAEGVFTLAAEGKQAKVPALLPADAASGEPYTVLLR